ncbi:MAG: glutamate synthase [Chloroflexi bacterium HGW-Chloroflexi-10]|nr:MAG: glutamate synthase [Chloroflexi bacterium HGW-Chloroflexi-10]
MQPLSIRTDFLPDGPYGEEHDACAIYLTVRKHGQSTFGTLKRSLGALTSMGHRTGFVNGEGDGAGVQTDIPRRLWTRKLSLASLRANLAALPGFWVGHLFIPAEQDTPALHDLLFAAFEKAGLNLIYQQPGKVRKEVLGGNARMNPPNFWQIAGYSESADLDKRLLAIQTSLEIEQPLHFSSLSRYVVVYKVRGSVETLTRYYADLQDRNFDTSVVLCHARYSTNTVSNFERAQPFSVLGHNGEINTIVRFRLEAEQIGAILTPNGSDSQDVDRAVHTMLVDYDLDLIEAMETVFPPVPYELEQLPAEQRAVYTRLRQSFGPYAQGPAAILGRYADTIIASVDAVGLRPLWYMETEKEYVFSSERGAVPLEVMVDEPRPLGPGEKMAIRFQYGANAEILDHSAIRRHVMNRAFQREAPQLARQYWIAMEREIALSQTTHVGRQRVSEIPVRVIPEPKVVEAPKPQPDPLVIPWAQEAAELLPPYLLAANGWNQDNIKEIGEQVEGKDTGSLGYDGPLAVLSKKRVNIADFFKETVAVVTNPAIDRGREVEVFSTSSLLGATTSIGQAPNPNDRIVTLKLPVLLGGHPVLGDPVVLQTLSEEFGTYTMETVLEIFNGCTTWLVMGVLPGETVRLALDRLAGQAVEMAETGSQCLMLDDFEVQTGSSGWLDPMLALSAVDEALRRRAKERRSNLRRRVGVVVRSAAIRNLHDIVLLSGFGADAVNPYAMFAVAVQQFEKKADKTPLDTQKGLLYSLKAGLEKVISTMGCHELRGYGRVCSSIGLAPSVAQVLMTPNYFGSESAGLNWQRMDQQAEQRRKELIERAPGNALERVDHFFPKLWKKVGLFTNSQASYRDVQDTFQQLKAEIPVALRHVVGFKNVHGTGIPSQVDLSVRDYALPFIISAMSFGSQGEPSFRAYADAAAQLDIVCINGEGGELPDMMNQTTKNRGQQVASGRFGVNSQFLNSAAVIEIKIGQGAKPGEGGMLPGYKVSAKVAEARHTTPGVSLLSPSNNHDLYSIEDLAQLIEELKVVNPLAKVSVKCPVVPGIGVIAVGIAKAGADIINLSGYDGGTGAARKHALQYVGLPAEVGVIQAHRALVESGLRHKVEIWCDGGMKMGEDVVKMVLLGANRVGFGTLAMVSMGCTICRKCEEGNCLVGITTQLTSVEEAKEKGVKVFTPLVYQEAVERLVRLFRGMAEELRQITAQLGAERLQDLVGRGDLLEQVMFKEEVDLTAMFESVPLRSKPELEPGVGRLLVRPRNNLTRLLSELITETVLVDDEREITYQDTVMAIDRALGSHIVGALSRHPEVQQRVDRLHLRFGPSSVAGNGFSAWLADPLDIIIEGGAQDGTAKGASGGRVAVMKGVNHEGVRIDGSVGKSFAYGAQKGTLIVQGNADSRACIRLSGADVVLGGEILQPVTEETLRSVTSANLKGFACEYMTAGRVLIMGDPGPYAFSGMTGGVVYQKLTPELGFDCDALFKRIALGAQVQAKNVNKEDVASIHELLGFYIEALEQTYQYETAEQIRLLADPRLIKERFVKVVALPPGAITSTVPVFEDMGE